MLAESDRSQTWAGLLVAEQLNFTNDFKLEKYNSKNMKKLNIHTAAAARSAVFIILPAAALEFHNLRVMNKYKRQN